MRFQSLIAHFPTEQPKHSKYMMVAYAWTQEQWRNAQV